MLEKLNNYENMENKMKINSLGAKIEDVTLDGKKIFFCGLRGDGKNGVTHPCTPNFGKDESGLNLPQHGPMRNSECVVLENEPNHQKLVYTIVHENYPKGVCVEQDFLLKNNQFILETIHKNNSDKNVPINFGEHCYFDAPNGWVGMKVNGQDITELIKSNGTIKLNQKNIIQIPGKSDLILEQEGLDYAVVWVYQNPETKEFDKNYVCIEPLQKPVESFGKTESFIGVGEIFKTILKISL